MGVPGGDIHGDVATTKVTLDVVPVVRCPQSWWPWCGDPELAHVVAHPQH